MASLLGIASRATRLGHGRVFLTAWRVRQPAVASAEGGGNGVAQIVLLHQESWTFRQYTNFAHNRNLPKRTTVSKVIVNCWYGVILIMTAYLAINWNTIREKTGMQWIPKLQQAQVEERDREAYEELVYEYGVEGVPKSIHAKYGHLVNPIKKVEAAELPSKESSSVARVGSSVVLPSTIAPEGESDGKKKGGFRDRKITEYENRIRAYSTPDKVFRLFATLKVHDAEGDGFGVYMTPDDFVRAITPGIRQPEGLGLDQFKTFDPEKDKLDESLIPKESIFYKLGENGLISFSDYLFLMTVLSTSARHIEIAFKIFDVNGDGTVDLEEFEDILTVLRSQTSVGMRHRESKLTGTPPTGRGGVNSGLKQLFFGKDGKSKLRVQDFLAFQERMKDEVLWMEFSRMDAVGGKIHETEFAKMLLSYSGVSEQRQKKMIKRIQIRFQGDTSKGITFQQVYNFSQVFRHLNDIDTALGLYHVAGGSIDQATLQRVVKTVAKAELDDHMVDLVFALFDDNEDGRLSQREFIQILKARQTRGTERSKDMGVTRALSAIWRCTKEEIAQSRV